MTRSLPAVLALCIMMMTTLAARAEEEKPAGPQAVELTGKATQWWWTRLNDSYYIREDFSFVIKDEATGKTWRVISREPTPAYHWRMGTTYTGLEVDWKSEPRVKVVGVTGIDRIPVSFYDFKLDEENIATVFIVKVEQKDGSWKDFYINNWFHNWGDANATIFSHYADKGVPYDIFGFCYGQAAPYDEASQKVVDSFNVGKGTGSMFHGLIRKTDKNPVGYEIHVLNLVTRDNGGNGVMLFGDPKGIPVLDNSKP